MGKTNATQVPIGGIMKLKSNQDWQPEDTDVIAWQRAFPKVNVHQELAAMTSWCDANPARRKTKAGIKRFVNLWLTKAQNQGGSPQAKAYSKPDSIRARTLDESLADISWLSGDQYLMMKQYYLQTRGFYFDGELKNG